MTERIAEICPSCKTLVKSNTYLGIYIELYKSCELCAFMASPYSVWGRFRDDHKYAHRHRRDVVMRTRRARLQQGKSASAANQYTQAEIAILNTSPFMSTVRDQF